MSLLTSAGLKTVPTSGSGLALAYVSAWTFGSWVEYIASAAANLQIAGLAFQLGGGVLVLGEIEVEIGVGALGAESAVARWKGLGQDTRDQACGAQMFPVPLDVIPAGSRVSLRVRGDTGTLSSTFNVTLLYYQGLTSTHASTSMMTAVPTGAAGASVGAAAQAAWLNNSWVQVTSGIGNEIALLGIAHGDAGGTGAFEFDLGLGGAGAEVVASTLRVKSGSVGRGGWRNSYLPRPLPVAASTRIAVRARQSSTGAHTYPVSLLYLDNTALLPSGASDYNALLIAP